MASELTTDRIYFLSDNGRPISECVTSIYEVIKLVSIKHPEASSMMVSVDDYNDGFGSVTFYNWEDDEDVTYQIESLKLVI